MSSSWPPNDHKDPGNVKNFELTLADTKVHKSGPIVSECLLLDKRKSKTKISQVLTRRLSQTEITIAAIIANLHNIGIIAQLQTSKSHVTLI
jgi:hypothetical protein